MTKQKRDENQFDFHLAFSFKRDSENITVNACHGMEKKDEDLEHYIAVSTIKNCPEGLSELKIPKQTWVVFDAVGKMPKALTTTWERVYTKWFPRSGYELAESPEMVKGIDDTKTEIWIPVKKELVRVRTSISFFAYIVIGRFNDVMKKPNFSL
ncbi:GyrI-like domain-containing protein [Alkalihalobacillus oceani]|uniref:GyrI-like domain-containing protein n=1 Tax=Halalkalibacter oceani TaxID=1653776 RepID=UPI00203C5D73|nr:GyrI-like domain-containing protein [Halalkalibacter oceani]MCM3763063.1 GyrI-like domain-containing protein [Halalkalibacter oceani]